MNDKTKSLLGVEHPCLDKGFVRLVDVMGNDSSIVQAARVSYGSGTKQVHEDRGLIRYLMRHSHTTPFEMVEFKFHVKLPIFIARQWIRHRMASVNEYSGRYSEMSSDFYVPDADQIRMQSSTNKQGSSDVTVDGMFAEKVRSSFDKAQSDANTQYTQLLFSGLARELARINLPVSNYTEWYWKIDLHNLFHFLRLRLDGHAQYEIRVYAEAIASIVKSAVPMAYEAFEDYVLRAGKFSRMELEVIRNLISGLPRQHELEEHGLSAREAREFLSKLAGE